MEVRNIKNLTASGTAHVPKNQHSEWSLYPEFFEHGRVEFFANFPFVVALLSRYFTGNPDGSATSEKSIKIAIKTAVHSIINDYVRTIDFSAIPENQRAIIIASIKSAASGIVPVDSDLLFAPLTPEVVEEETTPKTEVVETTTPKTGGKKSGGKTTAKK